MFISVMKLREGIGKYDRIRDTRVDMGITQTRVAQRLNIAQNTLSQYENGVINIPVDILIQLAVLYGVSVDYLLGLTDVRTPYPRKKRR